MSALPPKKLQELKNSIGILKQALPIMTQLDIAPTPENYAVWYHYAQGDLLALNARIDRMISERQPFTDIINHQLYVDFVDPSLAEMLTSSHQDTKLLIRLLLEKITHMHADTEHFSEELATFSHELAEHPDIHTLRHLVEKLLDETNHVHTINVDMRDSLQRMGDTVATLETNLVKLTQVAATDPLTGLANRRAFDEKLVQLVQAFQLKTASELFCLLMIDIDRFKVINDNYGHTVGDKVLIYVSSVLSNAIKGDDFIARFGGEEFVIILPNTCYSGGMAVAEHVRKRIAEKKLSSNAALGAGQSDMGHVTISIGVAQINSFDDHISLTERADKALYVAKKNGRNKVVGEQFI